MKLIISFLVLLVVVNVRCFSTDTSYSFEDRFTPAAVIHQLAEQLRFLIKSGDVENEVPILDPYEFQWKHLNFSIGEMLYGNANLTNGHFSGLGNFRLQQFNFSKSEVSIELDVLIPFLKFYSAYYELEGDIYEAVPLKGRGIANIKFHDILLWGKIYLKQSANGRSILLNKIENPRFSIQRITSQTQFDNNIDGIINSMVEDLLADYLSRFSKYIAASYSAAIVDSLNPTLNKFDNWNLIAVILADHGA